MRRRVGTERFRYDCRVPYAVLRRPPLAISRRVDDVNLTWRYVAAENSGGVFLADTGWFELGDKDQARSMGA